MKQYNSSDICTLISETIRENWMWGKPFVPFIAEFYEDEISFLPANQPYQMTHPRILQEYILRDDKYIDKIIKKVKRDLDVDLKYHQFIGAQHISMYNFCFYIGKQKLLPENFSPLEYQEDLKRLGLSAVLI